MNIKKEKIVLDGNILRFKQRVNLDNKTIPFKNKKKFKNKYKCRKKVRI